MWPPWLEISAVRLFIGADHWKRDRDDAPWSCDGGEYPMVLPMGWPGYYGWFKADQVGQIAGDAEWF